MRPSLNILTLPALLLATSCLPASAADLGAMAPPEAGSAELYAAGFPTDWTGFYAGVNAGYGLGHEDQVDLSAFPDTTPTDVGAVTAEGWLGGVQAGYNLQAGHFVLGVEADLQAADYTGRSLATVGGVTADATTRVDWYGTVRPRLGYAMGDALIYATGGLAFGGLDASIAATGIAGFNGTLVTPDLAWGYTLGAGAEYALSDQISLRGEYQFVQLRADATGALVDAAGAGTGVSGSSQVRSNMHAVKVGLNYRF